MACAAVSRPSVPLLHFSLGWNCVWKMGSAEKCDTHEAVHKSRISRSRDDYLSAALSSLHSLVKNLSTVSSDNARQHDKSKTWKLRHSDLDSLRLERFHPRRGNLHQQLIDRKEPSEALSDISTWIENLSEKSFWLTFCRSLRQPFSLPFFSTRTVPSQREGQHNKSKSNFRPRLRFPCEYRSASTDATAKARRPQDKEARCLQHNRGID